VSNSPQFGRDRLDLRARTDSTGAGESHTTLCRGCNTGGDGSPRRPPSGRLICCAVVRSRLTARWWIEIRSEEVVGEKEWVWPAAYMPQLGVRHPMAPGIRAMDKLPCGFGGRTGHATARRGPLISGDASNGQTGGALMSAPYSVFGRACAKGGWGVGPRWRRE
jgi:hypothetical protein